MCVGGKSQPPTSRAAQPYPSSAWLLLQVSPTENNKIGMVVVRGNSIVMMEALEKLWSEVRH